MKRRTFLAAAFGIGGIAIGGCSLKRALPTFPGRPDPNNGSSAGWVTHEDGRYALILPRVEMGQNISIALQQIAADELGEPLEALELRFHDTNAIQPVRATVGSESVKEFALPLARACAALRDAVAAGRSGEIVEVPDLLASDLRAFTGAGAHVGKSEPLAQGEAIVRGAPLYFADMRATGMLYGRVLRAPVSPEVSSEPQSWDAAAAAAEPGFHAIIADDRLQQGNSLGLGIVARTPGALDRIAEALSVVWRIDGGFEQGDLDAALDIDARLADGDLRYTVEESGDLDAVSAEQADVDLRFDIPAAPHAQIEPRGALAIPEADGGLKLWVGTQDAFFVRDVVAKALSLDAGEVRVKTCRVGGGFGGKAICLAELEASVLAVSVGAPVKLQWTREQEYRFAYHRPPSSHRLRATLEGGELADWRHSFVSSHILFTNAAMPRWLQWGTDLAVGDPGVARGAALPYRAKAKRVEHDLERLPLLAGPWRGLGAGPNCVALESTMDECARRADADPVAFRLAHIEDPRLARVLTQAVEDAGAAPASGGDRIGRGVACGIYKEVSYAGVVADVAIDADGAARVTGLHCAHDCGLVVNPDQVRAQCESNLVWGISMALFERLTVAEGGVVETSFAETRPPRISDVPEISVSLVESDAPPTGAGETVIVAAAAAVLNAIRDATGVRVTQLPASWELLKA